MGQSLINLSITDAGVLSVWVISSAAVAIAKDVYDGLVFGFIFGVLLFLMFILLHMIALDRRHHGLR
jgi:hypothetical protein